MADDKTTIIKSGGSNVAVIVLAVAVLIAAAVGFMIYQDQHAKNEAISGAASAVSGAAKDVGDAVKPE